MAVVRTKEATKTIVLDETKKEVKTKKVKSSEKEKNIKKTKKEKFLSPRGIKEEFSKITWPTRKKVIQDTIIIVIFLIFSSVLIGLSDYVISKVITAYTKTDPSVITLQKATATTIVLFAFWALVYVMFKRSPKKK